MLLYQRRVVMQPMHHANHMTRKHAQPKDLSVDLKISLILYISLDKPFSDFDCSFYFFSVQLYGKPFFE